MLCWPNFINQSKTNENPPHFSLLPAHVPAQSQRTQHVAKRTIYAIRAKPGLQWHPASRSLFNSFNQQPMEFLMTTLPTPKPRPIYKIALEISQLWQKPYFGAVPYLQAMRMLSTITDKYGEDSASSIVNYFLANAQTWRGEDARRIKAELNAML
jgi:hypothetical protein